VKKWRYIVKKIILILLILFVIVILFVLKCTHRYGDNYEAINFLKNIDAYSADVEIIVKNRNQDITYNTKQIFSKEFGHVVTINQNRVLTYLDGKIYVRDLNNGKTYIQNQSFDRVFKLSFVSEYIKMLYTNEEIHYSYKYINDDEYQLIHFLIPGTNKNINKAVLYIDTKELKPKRVYIYDIYGNKSIEVIYKNFNTNINIDKSLFDINKHTD